MGRSGQVIDARGRLMSVTRWVSRNVKCRNQAESGTIFSLICLKNIAVLSEWTFANF